MRLATSAARRPELRLSTARWRYVANMESGAGPAVLDVGERAASSGLVAIPLLGRGVIKRRPAVMRVLQRGDADRRAVSTIQRFVDRHGAGPLVAPIGRRRFAVVIAGPCPVEWWK